MASKLAALIFLPVVLFHCPSFAHESGKITTPLQICAHLVENFSSGVMISRLGVGFTHPQVELRDTKVTNELKACLGLMNQLPFRDEIMKDLPQLSELSWQKWNLNVSALTETRSNRKVDYMINHQGFMEIKIGSNSFVLEDIDYYEQVVSLLRKNKVEAMLYAGTPVMPFDPVDGFELRVSRLDLNNITTRAGLVKLLKFFEEN